jgi:hypothetical protein
VLKVFVTQRTALIAAELQRCKMLVNWGVCPAGSGQLGCGPMEFHRLDFAINNRARRVAQVVHRLSTTVGTQDSLL